MKKGIFIVVDGSDGSGKATQVNRLIQRFKENGCAVEMVDFPQYGKKSAGLVEEYLTGKYGKAHEVNAKAASIFYAVDRFDAKFKIKELLDQGKIVLANRYASSNMGHQTGKIKGDEERDKFLEWLDDLEFSVFGIPRPDMNILLYVPAETNQKLVDMKGHRDYVGGKKRDIHENDLQHLKDAVDAYLYVAKKYGWTVINCAPDGDLRSIEDIHEEVWQKVNDMMKIDEMKNAV